MVKKLENLLGWSKLTKKHDSSSFFKEKKTKQTSVVVLFEISQFRTRAQKRKGGFDRQEVNCLKFKTIQSSSHKNF